QPHHRHTGGSGVPGNGAARRRRASDADTADDSVATRIDNDGEYECAGAAFRCRACAPVPLLRMRRYAILGHVAEVFLAAAALRRSRQGGGNAPIRRRGRRLCALVFLSNVNRLKNAVISAMLL
ncbi:unnamed protein product, partial [Nesidiocoris tenuis]